MMTFIAFAAVAIASFLAGVISVITVTVWYDDHVEKPLQKRQAERDDLMAVSKAFNEN